MPWYISVSGPLKMPPLLLLLSFFLQEENAIAITAVAKNNFFILEIFNDGDIVFLERRGSTRNVNEYSFEDFKKRIELIINEELQVC